MSPRHWIALLVVAATTAGVAVEILAPDARAWLASHNFTTGVLGGALLIAATYLVIEHALEERERQRWRHAAAPLLEAIAVAGRRADFELRAAERCPQTGIEREQLFALLERYQALLTGTPELIAHWHAALSLAQHARHVAARSAIHRDSRYWAAWSRFQDAFADVHDFGAPLETDESATWAGPVVASPRETAGAV